MDSLILDGILLDLKVFSSYCRMYAQENYSKFKDLKKIKKPKMAKLGIV